MSEILAGHDWTVLLPVVVLVSQLIGKAIPDDATGFLGLVRKLAKILGLYVNNRITKDVTVVDPAKSFANLRNR